MSESAFSSVSSSKSGTAISASPPTSAPSITTTQAPPPSQSEEATPPPPTQSSVDSSSNSSTSAHSTGHLGAPPPTTSPLGVPPSSPPPPSPLENASSRPPSSPSPSPPPRAPPPLTQPPPTKNVPSPFPQEPNHSQTPPPSNASPTPIVVPSMPPINNIPILLPPPISSDPVTASPAPSSNIPPPLAPPFTPLPLQTPPLQQTSPGDITPPPSTSLPSPVVLPPAAVNASSSAPVTSGSQPTSSAASNGNTNSPPPPQNPKPSPSLSNESSGGSFERGFPVAASVSAFAAIVVIAAIIFVIVRDRRKNRKRDGISDAYWQPPANFSIKSDGYHQRGNTSKVPRHLESYYISGTPPSTTHGPLSDGFQGHGGYHSGTPDPGGKSWFSYEKLMEITNCFSRSNLIGEGGFGCVYKGSLSDGKQVAVKQLKAGSGQGEREFRAEVEIISRVHHRHLVSLVGFCIAENHRLLVYEFVPNKTLDHHLHGKGMPVMDWPKRLKIAIGSARGLAYLHEDCHPRIIHRDIKSANILLDEAWEAQVADFGLAKLANDTNTHVSTCVMGTFGYMAPEYATSGKLTDRSDVFSFGVVLLELITGRRPVDPSQPLGEESLVEWARPILVHALESGEIEQLVDPRLENNFSREEMLRMIEVAAACVRHSAPKRPRMVQVVRALDNDGEISDLSNGVKFGQSTVYDSCQYSVDIRNFRKMAFGSGDYTGEYKYSGESSACSSSEYDSRNSESSSELSSREAPLRPQNPQRPGEANYGHHQSISNKILNPCMSDGSSSGEFVSKF